MPARKLTVVALLVVVTACVSAAWAMAASSRGGPGSPWVVSASRRGVSDVLGRRYCELLIVHKTPAGFVADVYNTFTLNNCPEPAWRG